MLREVGVAVSIVWAAALWGPVLQAQNVDIWSSGSWTVRAPAGGNCGSLPLLEVQGPGSIFEGKNAEALAQLEKALPDALAKVCSGVREVILTSGRTRRLVRLPAASVAASVREPAAPAAPVESRPEPRRRAAPGVAAVNPPAQPALPAQRVASASTPPRIAGQPSSLKSLKSADDIEDKCEVLLAWLESSKSAAAPARMMRYRAGNEVLAIFRDEPMQAVFGTPYDGTENRWRLEQHEKVLSRCLGTSRARPGPFSRRPNRTLQQYSQQFAQYQPILDQAFLGTPGPYEPTAITRYLQQVRSQIAWAEQAMAAAAAATPTRESFAQIGQQQQAARGQLAMLSAEDREQVTQYLQRRQAELAPAVASGWFQQANATERNTAAAKVLHRDYANLSPVISALGASERASFQDKYRGLVESLISEPLQMEMAKLRAIPASLPGIVEVSGWKTRFDATFADLRGVPAVQAALEEYQQSQARIVTGALPAWTQEVNSIPAEGSAITEKRRRLEALFPSAADRSSPVYVQYQAPLRAKEDQLRLRVEAELRRQQQEQQQAAAAQAASVQRPEPAGRPAGNAVMPRPTNVVLTPGSFSASGLHNEGAMTALYTGDFVKIGFDRDQLGFVGFYASYLRSYGKQCDAYLPPNKVEITRQRCVREWVTRNGFGVEVSRSCAEYVTEGIGIYADPEMYAAEKKLDAIVAGDTFRHMGRMLTNRDPIGSAFQMVGDAQATKSDMEQVVQLNGCASPGLARFAENLKQFALNKPPIRLGESGPKLSAIDPLPGVPFRDQNYAKLVEDLVGAHSRTWVMNRYLHGSVEGVSVTSRDGKGRPAKVQASYLFNGFSGRSNGSVNVTFSDGVPECLYFHDFPATCRTPDRKIVAAYTEGSYSAP